MQRLHADSQAPPNTHKPEHTIHTQSQEEIGRQDYGVQRLHADSQALQGRLAHINREGFKKI